MIVAVIHFSGDVSPASLANPKCLDGLSSAIFF